MSIEIDDATIDYMSSMMQRANNDFQNSLRNSLLNSPVDREIALSNIAYDTEQINGTVQMMNHHVSNIDNQIIDLNQQIEKLNQQVGLLKSELEIERERANKAETQNKSFTVLVAVFGAVVSIGLTIFISWVKSLI